MVALYLFCAALGVPLLALFAFGSGDTDSDVDGGFDGDAGFDVDGDIGGDVDLDVDLGSPSGSFGDMTALFRRIPVSSYAFFLAFFGVMGLVGTALDLGVIMALIFALVFGVIAGGINAAAFSFLRRTVSTSHLTDRQLSGRLATVSVPIEAGKRGRVWLDTGDERLQLSAGAIDGQLDEIFVRGDQVVIVEVENSVARVMRADPELGS